MHVAMVIGGGTVLLGLCLLFGRLWGGTGHDYAAATGVFVPIWGVIALTNMWIGVTKAGYSVKDELPILLFVFAGPVVLAGLAIWRLAR